MAAVSWKAESGSHFLTDPGSGTEKVKNFLALQTNNLTLECSLHIKNYVWVLVFVEFYPTRKQLATLGLSNSMQTQ